MRKRGSGFIRRLMRAAAPMRRPVKRRPTAVLGRAPKAPMAPKVR